MNEQTYISHKENPVTIDQLARGVLILSRAMVQANIHAAPVFWKLDPNRSNSTESSRHILETAYGTDFFYFPINLPPPPFVPRTEKEIIEEATHGYSGDTPSEVEAAVAVGISLYRDQERRRLLIELEYLQKPTSGFKVSLALVEHLKAVIMGEREF